MEYDNGLQQWFTTRAYDHSLPRAEKKRRKRRDGRLFPTQDGLYYYMNKRNEMATQFNWDSKKFNIFDSQFISYAAISKFINQFNSKLSQKDISQDDFKLLFQERIIIDELLSKINFLAELSCIKFSENNNLLKYHNELNNSIKLFNYWWKNLSDKQILLYINVAPENNYYLIKLRKIMSYELSEDIEDVFSVKSSNSVNLDDIANNLFDMYKYISKSTLNDELKNAILQKIITSFGPIYKSLLKNWHNEFIVFRKYNSFREKLDVIYGLSQDSVDSMFNIIQDKTILIFNKYVKKLALGFKDSTLIYKYLSNTKYIYFLDDISLQYSLNTIKKVYHNFLPVLIEPIIEIIGQKRIKINNFSNNQYCFICNREIPTIISLNFDNKWHNLFALAHELMHAIHFFFSKNQSAFQWKPVTPLTEGIAYFGELLIIDNFINISTNTFFNNKLLIFILNQSYKKLVEDAFFHLFQAEVAQLPKYMVNSDNITKIYQKNLAELWGDNVELEPNHAVKWIGTREMFEAPLINYSYIFGGLLGFCLFQIYKEEGPQFADKFLRIISLGDSDSPENILRKAGLGPLNDKFWVKGFSAINYFIDQLK
ncbi:MAG: M3 family metallopeptidase [Deltaproteobacteria bacterium]|jgi:oligoendopeptidase F|nr:M3 family metallopeptidase [Deltaproteobacteria bacterium]